ncbi:60S ribosomal L6-like [Olea europaea subsp. europaea]|uniref:60S ribosomal L6-like n=1 Tax=Olea europaea subsp. europaea TaxID=158383 RepID=A0A8S0TI68_OLEEU|nr:60S ribosomal L6-like [Olea europaea subsp. europaea]
MVSIGPNFRPRQLRFNDKWSPIFSSHLPLRLALNLTGGRFDGGVQDGLSISDFPDFCSDASSATDRDGERTPHTPKTLTKQIVTPRTTARWRKTLNGSSQLAPKTRRVTHNLELINGVRKRSRSRKYHKRGLWAIKAKNEGKFPTHKKKSVVVEPAADKASKFDLAVDGNKPLSNKCTHKPTKSWASITPRTMLIILTGRFKGKLVVILNQLASGLLLVTGPFKINGFPLRRVNQAYIVATSSKVDISGVNVEKFDDKYFAKQAEKKKKGETEFFGAEREKKMCFQQRRKMTKKPLMQNR